MKILVAGGTGFIGQKLVSFLQENGHQVAVLTRKPRPQDERFEYITWNPETPDSVLPNVDGFDAVINLAGEPLFGKRWNKRQKERILASRVSSTEALVKAIGHASRRPKVLVNGSAVGFYGASGFKELTEEQEAGDDFLSDVAKVWESTALKAAPSGVRVVLMRTGIVLGTDGGALALMRPVFKWYLGGWLGSGNQWMSWIHLSDVIRIVDCCLKNPEIQGPVNATAPAPVTNKVFSLLLAQKMKRPCFMPVPGFLLELGLGEMAHFLLTGQRVIPRKLLDAGFNFEFPGLRQALDDLI